MGPLHEELNQLDWQHGMLARGLACYNRAQYFEAHEYWEDLWRLATGTRKLALQALIQLTVALCHHQRGNLRGARSMMQKSIARFALCPTQQDCIDVARIARQAQQWLDCLDHAPIPPVIVTVAK